MFIHEATLQAAYQIPPQVHPLIDTFVCYFKVKQGDIILHIVDNEKIIGVSLVRDQCNTTYDGK